MFEKSRIIGWLEIIFIGFITIHFFKLGLVLIILLKHLKPTHQSLATDEGFQDRQCSSIKRWRS